MWSFADFVSHVQPLIAAFESVGQAFSQGVELMRALHAKICANTGLTYRLYHVKHCNLAVGGCAIRRRYFWVVSQVPFGVEHPVVEPVTLHDAIGDLEDLPHTWEAQPLRRPVSNWAEVNARPTGLVDGHVYQPNREFRRGMDLLPVAAPWGIREPISRVARRYHALTGTLPESWLPNHDKFISRNFENMGYSQLIRWDYDQPARVITGGALYSVIHPTRDRLVTHREVARIMGFPDDWRIHPLRHQSNLRQTWGKGIPVGSGRWLSTWVRRSILGSPGNICGDSLGRLEFLIDVTRPRHREEVNAA